MKKRILTIPDWEMISFTQIVTYKSIKQEKVKISNVVNDEENVVEWKKNGECKDIEHWMITNQVSIFRE